MSGTYKLQYFPIAALGEPIRWMLILADKKFDDIRVSRDQWPAIKPSAPFGKMPLLTVDNGEVLHQTRSICRWLAKTLKLYGDNDWEALQIDTAVDTIEDLRTNLHNYYYDSNPATKAPKKEPLHKETLPYYLGKFDEQVKKNGGYFVNGKRSWADVYFVSLVEYFSTMAGVDNLVAKYPHLQALHDKIIADPKIKAYLAKRPPSQY